MINLHETMLPTSAGVEPATSWSPVGRRIQPSHRGRLQIKIKLLLKEQWLESALFAFPLSILKNACIKTKIKQKKCME